MLKKTPNGQYVKPTAFTVIESNPSIYEVGGTRVKVQLVVTEMNHLFEDPEGETPILTGEGHPAINMSGQLSVQVQPIATTTGETQE